MARIGGMLTPFCAQVLLQMSPALALAVYSVVNVIGALCVRALPLETAGSALQEDDSGDGGSINEIPLQLHQT